jgi:hypothetical protein
MRYIVYIFLTLMVTAMSCKKDPVIPNEEELITTLIYTLTPVAGGASVVFSFRDLDGDGGVSPVISNGILSAGEVYEGKIELLNEAETPAVIITDEVEEEGEEHQFFFISNIANATVTYSDLDLSGYPVGLTTQLTTGDPATGTLTIVLRHLPDKAAQGVRDGLIANAGGETDIEVAFPLMIE